jgi:hypothetical protein
MAITTPVAIVAAELHATDLMVFEIAGKRVRLLGGVGRGAGWAGIVEVMLADEPVVQRVVEGSRVVRVDEPQPVRVVGPYWSAHAALVRVGQRIVVAGPNRRFGARAPSW